jgi:hypothetical protein
MFFELQGVNLQYLADATSMKQKGNGPQNFGVFSVSVKEGERLARYFIYFFFW